MANLEVFDQKRTKWEGLWYHNDTHYYSSAAINLSQLKKFKGTVRIFARKNRWYNDGENGRPNMVFTICDSDAENPREIEVEGISRKSRSDTRGKLFTYDEIKRLVEEAAYSGAENGDGWVDISDFIDWDSWKSECESDA